MTRQPATSPVAGNPQPWYVTAMERGLVPDALVRWGIRRRLSRRLRNEASGEVELDHEHFRALLAGLRRSRIAVHTDMANEQHYELPPEFFERVLGSHLKYSSGLWSEGIDTLDQAEEAMLELYCERAELSDGQDILELGCGWGSLSLFLAQKYPNSRIVGVSNSHGQREFIEGRRDRLGLGNLQIVTSDVNEFVPTGKFDRVLTIEMFEHMRNYRELLSRISSWMKPDSRLFVHIFTHRETAYFFETSGADEWLAKNFFTGGIMPSDHLLHYFQDDLILRDHWRVNGRHYALTAEAWLERMDENRDIIQPVLDRVYGDRSGLWRVNWRLFFLACAELWGYRSGNEWFVSHYLFAVRPK